MSLGKVHLTFHTNPHLSGAILSVKAYLRVSTDKQDISNQELEVFRYCAAQKLPVDEWVRVEMSTKKSEAARGITELVERLEDGDHLVVSELSRLGRSVQQLVTLLPVLTGKGVTVHLIKQGIVIRGGQEQDIGSKVMVTVFALLAEVERDLIRERTKMGLARAREQGRRPGRPKGSTGKSKLDGREEEIRTLLGYGVSRRAIARMMKVNVNTMCAFIKSRGIKAKAA